MYWLLKNGSVAMTVSELHRRGDKSIHTPNPDATWQTIAPSHPIARTLQRENDAAHGGTKEPRRSPARFKRRPCP